MMRRPAVLLSVLLSLSVQAQRQEKVEPENMREISFVGGGLYHHYAGIETSFSYSSWNRQRATGFGLMLGSQYHLRESPDMAFKFSFWITGVYKVLAFSITELYYTDFKRRAVVFRPEAGLSYKRIRLLYGYNVPDFTRWVRPNYPVYRHSVSLSYVLQMKELMPSTKKIRRPARIR